MLVAACADCRNPWIQLMMVFALETAARKGEILAGLSVLELRAISGHTTANMLQRYGAIDASDLVVKLLAGCAPAQRTGLLSQSPSAKQA